MTVTTNIPKKEHILEDSLISKKKAELNALQHRLELIEQAFELYKKGCGESPEDSEQKLIELLASNSDVYSYFLKFGQHAVMQMSSTPNGFLVKFSEHSVNRIFEDIQRLKTELEEKENRLEQLEYIRLQKEDLKSAKADRDKNLEFTFIIALGVVAGVLFNLYTLLVDFEKAETTRHLLYAGAFAFAFLFFFVVTMHKIRNENFEQLSRANKIYMILAGVGFIFFVLLLIFVPKDSTFLSNMLFNDSDHVINVNPITNVIVNNSVPDRNVTVLLNVSILYNSTNNSIVNS